MTKLPYLLPIQPKMLQTYWLTFLGVLLASLFNICYAAEDSIKINPIVVNLNVNHPIGLLYVTNQGQDSVTMQATPTVWVQRGNNSTYPATNDLIVVPPVFTLAPKATQIVRIKWLGAANNIVTEKPYHLFFDELPSTANVSNQKEIKILFDISMPVYVQNNNMLTVPAILQYNLTVAGNILHLNLTNPGLTHILITALTVKVPGKTQPVFVLQGLGVLLPGNRFSFSFPKPQGQTQLQLDLHYVNNDHDNEIHALLSV